ncbi:MAG: MATE family efflux transporter [Synergistaceae bacterium]|nr:MATE family efflux transporter [Synergistaceae bacterium]
MYSSHDGNRSNSMDAERIPRLMARFAAPALVGMFANALYNIVDRVFVGQIVGAQGIAAIALSFPAMLLFFCVATLIGTGAASRVAILMGERRISDAEQTLGGSFTLALASGVFLAATARIFIGDILVISGASETLYPLAHEYLSYITYGIVFGIVSFSLSYQIRASGSPVYAMGTQVVGALSNVALDALFVIGFGMGVGGAAIATVISQGISLCWALAYFWLPGAALRIRIRYMIKFDIEAIKRIFAIGAPASLVQLNFVFVHGLITNTSNTYGGDLAVSATGIFMGLDSLLFMPAVALGEACTPIIGYNYGAGKIDRVISTVKNGVVVTSAFYLLSFIAIMLFAENMVMMFNSKNTELISFTARCMRYANIGIPVMSVSIICTSLLQGLGRGRDGMMLAAVRFGLFLWTPLLILPRYYGILGVWASFPISDVRGTLASGIFMFHTIKRLRGKRGGS